MKVLTEGFYAGAIGYIRFNGDINHAIMIRTILSQKNRLYYQAGGGIVSKSNPQSELQEANNKRAALKSSYRNGSLILFKIKLFIVIFTALKSVSSVF